MNSTRTSVAPVEKLRTLVGLRIDLIEVTVTLKKRLDGIGSAYAKDRVESYLNVTQKHIDELASDIGALVKQDDILSRRAEIIASLPGLDRSIAAVLAADMPWEGKSAGKPPVGAVRVLPYTKESGVYVNGAITTQRRELQAAALATLKINPKIKAFYDKQLKDGKTSEAALVSVMHKLIIIINSMVKKGTKWVEEVGVVAPPVKRF